MKLYLDICIFKILILFSFIYLVKIDNKKNFKIDADVAFFIIF